MRRAVHAIFGFVKGAARNCSKEDLRVHVYCACTSGSTYCACTSTSTYCACMFTSTYCACPWSAPTTRQARAAAALWRAHAKAWSSARGKELPPPRLHPTILRTIREWCGGLPYTGPTARTDCTHMALLLAGATQRAPGQVALKSSWLPLDPLVTCCTLTLTRFDLVDDDGSGTLEHHELMAALQVRGHDWSPRGQCTAPF